ncbi:hypothetical protein PORY_000148 [Pneumocystis oryctolagi]|uniref:Uncharacterized protein n=1 Tax=Pneumocystis oryctolagi TaxID=42067 RepID=A0ACB7CGA7_9ASCO|nr:hypothetical protein PORY_000148 [Pneumocystis oryctolagi]
MRLIVKEPMLGILVTICVGFFLLSFWFVYYHQRKHGKNLLVTIVAGLSMVHMFFTICLYPMDLFLVSSRTFFPKFLWIVDSTMDLTVDRMKLLLFFIGFFIATIQTDFSSKINLFQQILTADHIKKIMFFIVGVLLLIGIVFFCTYTALGFSLLPLWVIKMNSKNIKTSTLDMKHALILNRERQRTIELRYIGFHAQMNAKDRRALEFLQREERTLVRRIRLAEEGKKKWLQPIFSIIYIFQLIMGNFLFFVSIITALSMTITLISKLKNTHYKTFPVNLTIATFLIFYLCATSIMGIFNISKTININFFKFSSYKKGNSLPHTLLISIAILILTVFSFNYTLSEIIIPRYSHFGNQTYCNYTVPDSQDVYDCVNHPEYIFPCSKTKDHAAIKFCTLSIRYIFFKKYNYINQKLFSSFPKLKSKNTEANVIESTKYISDIEKLNNNINNVISYLKKESESFKMGRSNPSLLHNLRVSIPKGKSALLKELAHVSMKNNKSMILTIYDSDNIKYLISTIRASSLGLNPVVNPSNPLQYVIPLPPLTKEGQKKILKQISELGENAEINIRNIRTINMKHLKKAKQQGEVSEDETRLIEKDITKIINQASQEVKKIIQDTKKNIMEQTVYTSTHPY